MSLCSTWICSGTSQTMVFNCSVYGLSVEARTLCSQYSYSVHIRVLWSNFWDSLCIVCTLFFVQRWQRWQPSHQSLVASISSIRPMRESSRRLLSARGRCSGRGEWHRGSFAAAFRTEGPRVEEDAGAGRDFASCPLMRRFKGRFLVRRCLSSHQACWITVL